ncbi:FAD dependent oxidoreductase family protein [Cyanobium sp. NS01]|nr:FAD dependent oxidoreductase family protein [Cyanobium sp. NS01]
MAMAAAVVVVGGGLCGGLVALELAALGLEVVLLEGGGPAATELSYGLMPLPAALPWLRLQLRHGPLGLRCRWLRLHSAAEPAASVPWLDRLPLPAAQVEAPLFLAALPAALAAAGVQVLPAQVRGPLQRGPGGWRLVLEPAPAAGGGARGSAADPGLEAAQVVLAAGGGCRQLWPALAPGLQTSWAGVLELAEAPPRGLCWPAELTVPRRFQRPALKRQTLAPGPLAWVVDAGLVPSADRWLAGQISLVGAEAALGAQAPDTPQPDPAAMEERLRQGLSGLSPALAGAPARYRQVPVTFSPTATPLVGPVGGAPGLWVLSGFSAAFSQVPQQALRLAQAIATAAADPVQ